MISNLFSALFICALIHNQLPTLQASLLKANTKLTIQQNVTVITPSNVPQGNDRFFIINGPCSQNSCHTPFAYCGNPTQCVCNAGYANFGNTGNQNANTNTYCTYQQKKQLNAFLLEFFLPLGAGHFYASRVTMGIIKLITFLAYMVMYCVMNNNLKNEGSITFDWKIVLTCGLCCGIFIWQIVDLVKFGINSYNDGQGVPLASW